MSTENVTMKGFEWAFLWELVRAYPAPPAQAEMEQQERHRKLYYFVKAELKKLDGKESTSEYTIAISGRRRRMLADMLGSPPRPWPMAQLYEVVNPIRVALGWTPPDEKLSDDEESDDE
jgi:hypothetical protein